MQIYACTNDQVIITSDRLKVSQPLTHCYCNILTGSEAQRALTFTNILTGLNHKQAQLGSCQAQALLTPTAVLLIWSICKYPMNTTLLNFQMAMHNFTLELK